jgi:phage terminase small subunit
MALTEKMKKFSREYISNGGNDTEAYIAAYDTTNKTTAMNESSKLLKRKDINEYIKTLSIPLENKAISEREKKRKVLWNIIESPDSDNNDICRAMDILNKMDQEYINISKNIDDSTPAINNLDTTTLLRLVE